MPVSQTHIRNKKGLTKDTPNVSHLASERGKTGKSTARMARNVISSICERYTVKAGSGIIDDMRGLPGCGGAEAPAPEVWWISF